MIIPDAVFHEATAAGGKLTWNYLRQLEEAQRIQSAQTIMDMVRQTGRNPSLRDLWSGHGPEVKDAVIAILEQPHQNKPPGR